MISRPIVVNRIRRLMRNAMPAADEYRDDRMYVMRISSNSEKLNDGLISFLIRQDDAQNLMDPVVLITYRNTYRLPAVRADEFDTIDDALSYIKRVEPTCPRISLGRQAHSPTPTWEAHLAWLHSEGLKSAAEGDCPVSHWIKDSK